MPSFILELKPEYNLVKIDNSPEDNIVDTSKIGGIRKLLILKFPTKHEAFWLIFSPTVNYFEAHSIAGLQDLDFDLNKLAVLNYSGSILIEHLDHEQPIHGYEKHRITVNTKPQDGNELITYNPWVCHRSKHYTVR